MNDITNNILEYLDKKEIDISTFLIKYNEKDIVNSFIRDFDKINFKYKNFLESVIDDIDVDGVFYNYTKNIFKYSMHLIFNFDNAYGIILVEPKIRRLCNIYINANTNIINVINSIDKIITFIIDTNLYKYENFKRTIIHIIISTINNNLTVPCII